MFESFHRVIIVIAAISISCVPPGNGGANDNIDNNQNGNGSVGNDNGASANDNGDDGEPQTPVWREAFDASQEGFISAVWGLSPNDVFVVGGQIEQGTVNHFNGTTWTAQRVPTIPILVWVYGFARNDVIAVGQGGGIIHFDGVQWQRMDSPTTNDLWGVWGAASDDVWAVGGRIDTGPPIILHYDGIAWSQVDVPPLDRESTALLKVWGTADDHVFSVGQSGVILEYHGQGWQQVSSGTTDDLVSLWGSGPFHIFAIGGRVNGTIVEYDGLSWTTRSLSPLPGLNGIFVGDLDEASVVGLIGTAALVDLDSFTFSTETTPTAATLHAVWGDGADAVYAVGGQTTTLPYSGVVLVRSSE